MLRPKVVNTLKAKQLSENITVHLKTCIISDPELSNLHARIHLHLKCLGKAQVYVKKAAKF